MKTLMSVIRDMSVVVEEAADLGESTKAYADSLEKIANDKKLKSISKKDRETLAKIAELMKGANESVEYDNEFLEAVKAAASEEDALNEAIEKLVELEEARIDAADYTVGAEKSKKGYRGQVTHTDKGHTMYLAGKNFKDEKDAKAHAQAYLDGYARGGDRAASKDADNFVKRNSSKLAEEVIAEDYFTVQYYDAKGKAEEGKSKDFKDEKSAKKHLDKANKVVKDGEYKMFKVKGSMDESVELEEHISRRQQDTIKGASNPYGVSAALIDAVNSVVTGQAESVDINVQDENEIIEHGAQELGEARQMKDPKKDSMVTKDGKTIVIDKSKEKEFLKKGWALAENETVAEGADGGTGDKEEYQKFFQAALKKFGASSPADLDDKKKKEFYDYIDANWKGDDEKAESKEDDDDKDKKGSEKVEINPKLDEAAFKEKYGSRWEAVLEATANKLAMKK